MKLQEKVAIVTGGSRGIGEAISRRFAAEGASVVLVYNEDDRKANEVVQELRARGCQSVAFKADCAKVEEINRLVREIVSAFGNIDILVNNAGIFRAASLEDTTEEIWDGQLDLNLKGAFFLTKAIVPEFKLHGGGRVINITSTAALVGMPNCSAYCASKGGLAQMTMALASELAKYHINVNAIAPGNVRTRANEQCRTPGMETFRQRLRDMTPTGRDYLETNEVAGAAVFLASDDARAIHGATITVDDGWTAW